MRFTCVCVCDGSYLWDKALRDPIMGNRFFFFFCNSSAAFIYNLDTSFISKIRRFDEQKKLPFPILPQHLSRFTYMTFHELFFYSAI